MKEDEDSIRNFFNTFPRRSFSKREIILNSGDEISSIFYINSGIARSFYTDEAGNQLTINLLKPYSFFPLSSVLAGKNSAYDFEAFTELNANIAPTGKVLKFLKKNNVFKNIIIEKFARGLEGYLLRSFFLIKGSAMQKVSSTFLMLVKRFGKSVGETSFIDLPFTHQDIADLSGLTRETASIQIELLEKEKILSRKGRKTIILNYQDLNSKAMVGDDGSLLNFSF